MPRDSRFKLTLSKLSFISAVDVPAQETAVAAIIKRGKRDEITADFLVAKVDDELGIVMGWALTSTVDGKPYFDLQGDAIQESDLVKVAAEYMADGGYTDEMHSDEPDGRVVFCWPLTTEIAGALDIETAKTGLLVGIKPSPDVLEKFKSGEYTGFSIAGMGSREAVGKAKTIKCEKCSSYMAKDAVSCKGCGAPAPKQKRLDGVGFDVSLGKATWTTAYMDDLPDSAFLYVEGGGSKDSSGKTTPRSLRHFPYKDVNGKIDIAHLRDATGRIPQSSLPASLKEKLQQKAEKILAAQHAENKRAGSVAKHAYLTTAVAGHTHLLDHDNGQAAGYTEFATMGDGSEWHQHPWVRNTALDTFVLGEAAGHVHEVMPQERIDELVASGEGDVDEDDQVKRASASPRGTTMKTPAEQITDLTEKLKKRDAEIERLRKKSSMTDAQHAFYKSIEKDEAKAAFLDKSHADRDAEVGKSLEQNPVVIEFDGVQYRKNDDPRMIAMAKRSKEQAETIAKRDAELDTERLTKRAGAELGNLPGKVDDKVALLKALDAIPEANRAGAKALVTAGQNAMAPMFKGIGHVGTSTESASAQEQLDQLTKQHAEKNNVAPHLAMAAVMKTVDGKRLYAEIERAKRTGN